MNFNAALIAEKVPNNQHQNEKRQQEGIECIIVQSETTVGNMIADIPDLEDGFGPQNLHHVEVKQVTCTSDYDMQNRSTVSKNIKTLSTLQLNQDQRLFSTESSEKEDSISFNEQIEKNERHQHSYRYSILFKKTSSQYSTLISFCFFFLLLTTPAHNPALNPHFMIHVFIGLKTELRLSGCS